MKLILITLILCFTLKGETDLFKKQYEAHRKEMVIEITKELKKVLAEKEWEVLSTENKITVKSLKDIYYSSWLEGEVWPNKLSPDYNEFLKDWEKRHKINFEFIIEFKEPLKPDELKRRLFLKSKLLFDLSSNLKDKPSYLKTYKALYNLKLPVYNSDFNSSHEIYITSPLNHLGNDITPIQSCLKAEFEIRKTFLTKAYSITGY